MGWSAGLLAGWLYGWVGFLLLRFAYLITPRPAWPFGLRGQLSWLAGGLEVWLADWLVG